MVLVCLELGAQQRVLTPERARVARRARQLLAQLGNFEQ
jgi:hypothetical protein